MNIYSLVLIPMLLISLLEFSGFKKIYVVKNLTLDKVIFIYSAIALCLIAALRFKTGRDWSHYLFFFEHSLTRKIPVEQGYMLVNKFFKQKFNDFYFQQVCINCFCSFCIFRVFFKESKYPVFTLLLYVLLNYFFTTDMAQVRQHIAMAIICCGTRFIKQKKILWWILILILAMQFHITSFLAFPLYFTNRKEISYKTALLFLFLAVLITLAGLKFVRGVVELAILLPFLPEQLANTLQRYFTSKTEGQFLEMSSGLGYWGRYVFYVLLIFLFAFMKRENNNYFLLNLMIAVVLQAMGRNFDQFARVANYYLICGCGLCAYNIFPDSKVFFKKADSLRFLCCSVFVIFTFLTFYSSWSGNYKKDYAPYKTFIFEEAY